MAGWQTKRMAGLTLGFAMLVVSSGCARYPSNRSGLSGRRITVTMTFRGAVDPNFHYYFIINNAGDVNAPGPVPVLYPPYGNGFATGSNGSTSGFTDFILFDSSEPNGAYGMYHVLGTNANQGQFVLTGVPVSYVIPNPTDTTYNRLQFTFDMSQLITDANGQPLTDAQQAAAEAQAIRYLQVNIVATDVVPKDSTTTVSKQVDALGNTQDPAADSSFLVLDTSQNRTYSNENIGTSSLLYEPQGDVFTSGGDVATPEIDLIDWSITIQNP